MQTNHIKNALFGLAIGDALGVPVEFKSREYLDENPVTTMLSHGTYNQARGTWSDDSSLTFCLADSLCNGYNLTDIARKFIDWKHKAIWTARGEVFDIGQTTSNQIEILKIIVQKKDFDKLKTLHRTGDEHSNGNGSLMRILPLVFYLKTLPEQKRFETVLEVSALTHPHLRAAIACYIYLVFADFIISGENKETAYKKMQIYISDFFEKENISNYEREIFSTVINNNIADYEREDILSSGYVIDSLEAALWCVLNNETYTDTVLEAVNLGYDTDTTAAIAGGIAGLIYGYENIPELWTKNIAAKQQIENLSNRFGTVYNKV